jgi:hypothetical protein
VIAFVVVAVFACTRHREDKNDDIAACHAGGGRWVEGGCNDSTGHCEKSNGAAPDDDDDDYADDPGEEAL